MLRNRKAFKIFASLFFSLIIFGAMAIPALAYDDDDTNPFLIATQWGTTNEIIHGYQDGSFHWEQNVTRAEFATMLGRAMRVQPVSGNCFPDVTSYNAEMKGNICALASLGVISGYQNGNFGPNDPVTLAQQISMITRAITDVEHRYGWNRPGPERPGVYTNVTGGHRTDLLVYLGVHGGEVYGSPNNNGPLLGAHSPVNRGMSIELLMIAYWDYSQGPCVTDEYPD